MADENPIPDLGQMVAEALAAHGGDVPTALKAMLSEQLALTAESESLKNSVALSAAEAAEWEEYRKLGKPADFTKLVEELPALAAKKDRKSVV